jgi:hypothetical protein
VHLAPIPSDSELIAALYRDPWVSRVGHDHRPASPVHHPSAHYLGAYVHGAFVGAFLVIESGWVELDLHALLSRRALPACREFGRLCLAAAFAWSAEIQRVTAYVLQGLESARNYCRKLGFVDEGMRRDAARINGAPVGVYVLGMTRSEWEGSK